MSDCCESCRFFVLWKQPSDRIFDGFCRRFPPQSVVKHWDDGDTNDTCRVWPQVDRDDWCGEWAVRLPR